MNGSFVFRARGSSRGKTRRTRSGEARRLPSVQLSQAKPCPYQPSGRHILAPRIPQRTKFSFSCAAPPKCPLQWLSRSPSKDKTTFTLLTSFFLSLPSMLSLVVLFFLLARPFFSLFFLVSMRRFKNFPLLRGIDSFSHTYVHTCSFRSNPHPSLFREFQPTA